ncbi:MAG: hypothetical protein ACFFDT_26425 [Candidatus Hodarchaeota archaeon]
MNKNFVMNRKMMLWKRKKRTFFLLGLVFILSFSFNNRLLSNSDAIFSEVVVFTSLDIPTIEIGTPFQGTFSQEEINLGETVIYFYVDIRPGVYEMALTMSPVVYYARAEFRSVVEIGTSFGNFQVPQFLDSDSFRNFDEEGTVVETFILLHENLENEVGLSLYIEFDATGSGDRDYEIEITKQRIPKKSNVIAKYDQEEREVREYFSLDLDDLDVNRAGFYNLTTLMSVTATSTVEYADFDGDFRVRSIYPEDWYFYSSIYFYYDEVSDEVDYDIVFLDPDQDYYFEAYGYCWMDDDITEVEVTCQFDAERISSTTLNSGDSVDISAGQHKFIEIDIPSEDSVRITVKQADMAEYRLTLLTQGRSTYYHSFGNFSDYNDKELRSLLYIQLAQREIDKDIIDYGTTVPTQYSNQIIMGGIVSTRYGEYSDPGYYLGFWDRCQVDLIDLPLLNSEDSLYLSISSEEDITVESKIVEITDIPESETIDLLDDDPLRMYNVEVSSEDAFNFEHTSEFETTSPALSEDDDVVEYLYQSDEVDGVSQMLLPGYPFPISSNNGFQYIGLKEGTGLFVYSPYYRLYRDVNLNQSDPDAYNVDIDDIRVEILKATGTMKFTKTKVPEITDLIDINLNISQPIQFFTFPVDEGAIYNLTVECLPFDSYSYIFITDIEGDNPFYNLEAFATFVGQSGYLVGRKNTKAYLIIVGRGPVRIHLEKVGTGGKIKSEGVSTPAFEVLSVLLIFPVLAILKQRQRKHRLN